jgi:hypothetical protein
VRLKPKLASPAVPVAVPVPLATPTVSLSNREEAARAIWSSELETSCAKDRLATIQSRYADTYYGDLIEFIGAGGGTRTRTTLLSQDFKSCVSTVPPRPRTSRVMRWADA